jgi:DNA-binding PucR family transcriptional regulator
MAPRTRETRVLQEIVSTVASSLELDEVLQRGSALLATLEEFLRRRGSISATSEALYVHQTRFANGSAASPS